MNIYQLLNLLNKNKIRCSLKQKKLKIDAPKGVMTKEILSLIKLHKSELISYISTVHVGNSKLNNTIPILNRANELVTSFAQQRLWFIDRMQGSNSLYNMHGLIDVKGFFNVAAAQQAFNRIIQRHEPLRTVFADGKEAPIQIINQRIDLSITYIDVKGLKPKQQQHAIENTVKKICKSSFDLKKDMMLRVAYLRQDTDKGILFFNIHHIAADGWSISILLHEFAQQYQAIIASKTDPFTALKIQYADYANWQRDWLKGEVLDKQLQYWRRQLADLPIVHQFPLDRKRPQQQTFNGRFHYFNTDKKVLSGLKQLALENQATMFMVIHAAFALLLSRYSNSSDAVIGTPVANRLHKDLEPLIGFFVNTLILRSNCEENSTFVEFLQQIKSVNLAAQTHQDIPFERLVDLLNPDRNTSHSPLYQIMLVMDGHIVPKIEIEGLSFSKRQSDYSEVKFDLILDFSESENGLLCNFEYNQDLFDLSSIKNLSNSLLTLLKGVATVPSSLLSKLPILNTKEQYYLISTLNQAEHENIQGICLHQLFEQQAKKSPNKVALKFKGKKISYQELNIRANQLSHYLIDNDVVIEDVVGLYLDRSIEMIVTLLAILKAGAAYLPLDPSYPQQRLTYMLTKGQVKTVVSSEKIMNQFMDVNTVLIDNSKIKALLQTYSKLNPVNNQLSENNLAYVIFTSGSTGQPKGVMIEHRSVVNLATNVKKMVLGTDKYWGWIAPLSFDASLQGISMLCKGQALHLISDTEKIDYHQIKNIFKQNSIGVVDCTPTLLEIWLDLGLQALLPDLIIGGESISFALWKHLLDWQQQYGKKAINVYGPTECCVDSSASMITSETPNIGQALANYQFYVLDKYQELTPFGAIGELYITGSGLARGYLNSPDLTTKKFTNNPYIKNQKQRMYRTGDMVRYLADGNLAFMGRVDNQVKIRGYRIELGEIENQILLDKEIKSAIVTVYKDETGNELLVAYAITKSKNAGDNTLITRLKIALSTALPEYMQPWQIMVFDSLPLTINGKIDYKALPKPEKIKKSKNFQAPKNNIEHVLCEIWSKLLNLEYTNISVDASFFELGGHSLLSIQLLTAIREKFSIELSIKNIFKTPYITGLAKIIYASKKTKRLKIKTINRGEYHISCLLCPTEIMVY